MGRHQHKREGTNEKKACERSPMMVRSFKVAKTASSGQGHLRSEDSEGTLEWSHLNVIGAVGNGGGEEVRETVG